MDLDQKGQPGQFESRLEARACFSLCAVKEFLVFITLFLILVDLVDVYSNIIRLTGTDLLPFPGNHTEFYSTHIDELNYYDMCVSAGELLSVVVLTLAVCQEKIDGIVCALCGFASCMLLEFAYMAWLVVAVLWDVVAEHLTSTEAYYTILYAIVPYLAVLLVRMYTLCKAQAFRRSLMRNKLFRERMNENSNLLARP